MQERQQIGVLLIATRRYKIFVQNLIDGIKRNFLLNHDVRVFLFTDEFGSYSGDDRVNIEQHHIPDYKYPEATLFRYKIFGQHTPILSKMDFLFYLDVDMSIYGIVGDEILNEGLMAVAHPGFFINNGWGDSSNPSESSSYLPKEKRRKYYCGGTQGGDSYSYLVASVTMAIGIDEDEMNGIRAEWNDETHWNWFLHTTDMRITEFSPSYCMPEPIRLRVAWGISNLETKIIALDKNHSEIRS